MGQRNVKLGLALVLLSLSWCAVAFGLRPMVVGDTHDYASRVLRPILTDPLNTLGARFSNLKGLKRILQCVLPFSPVIWWQIKNRVSPDWVLLSGAIPMLGIRFLDGAWEFHYMAPVTAVLVAGMWKENQPGLPPRYAVMALVITMLVSLQPISSMTTTYGSAAEWQGARRTAIEEVRGILLKDSRGSALVGANLTPLLAQRADIAQIGGKHRGKYRFLFTEKPPAGNPWPLNHHDIEHLIHKWRSAPTVSILRDDDFVFFAERL